MYPFWKYFLYSHFSPAGSRGREVLAQMTDLFSRASRKDYHIAGIRIVRVWKLHHLTSIEILGLPLIQIRYFAYKKCWYLGKLEIWKERISGPMSGRGDGPLMLHGQPDRRPRLFWNIGPLAFADNRTGVPRVARSLLSSFLSGTAAAYGYEVCPIYTTGNCAGYFHARSYVRQLQGKHPEEALDTPAIFAPGDILVSPVPDAGEVETHVTSLKALQEGGVKIFFIVHDLIPLQHPEFCPEGFRNGFLRWLPLASKFDGVLTVSASVAEDYRRWRRENKLPDDQFFVDWFHLGGDLQHAVPTRGMPDDALRMLSSMRSCPTFLTVSTVEPRKGYRQALDAFEMLWSEGTAVNFVIVGREGWNARDLADRMKRHPERGRHLFWLSGISDEYLDKIYAEADAVLFPSYAEGFGLAVAEGASHGKPLILRDIPVFREIAGEHATYFRGNSVESLACCLKDWLHCREEGTVISSSGISVLTWDESAEMLLSRLPK